MKTLFKVVIEPIYVDVFPDDDKLEDRKFYISEKYRTACHLCLCGCGMKTVTGLNHDLFPNHWELVKEKNGTISLIGSIGNFNFPCKSHYIITKNVANFV